MTSPSVSPARYRPDWLAMGLAEALLISRRSTDSKTMVGCAIISDDSHQIAALGYNGKAPGEAEVRDSMHAGQSGFLHAEDNAIRRTNWVYGERHTVYVTHEPCTECARRFLTEKRHLSQVIYVHPYYSDAHRAAGVERGADLLTRLGIPARAATPEELTNARRALQDAMGS